MHALLRADVSRRVLSLADSNRRRQYYVRHESLRELFHQPDSTPGDDSIGIGDALHAAFIDANDRLVTALIPGLSGGNVTGDAAWTAMRVSRCPSTQLNAGGLTSSPQMRDSCYAVNRQPCCAGGPV